MTEQIIEWFMIITYIAAFIFLAILIGAAMFNNGILSITAVCGLAVCAVLIICCVGLTYIIGC